MWSVLQIWQLIGVFYTSQVTCSFQSFCSEITSFVISDVHICHLQLGLSALVSADGIAVNVKAHQIKSGVVSYCDQGLCQFHLISALCLLCGFFCPRFHGRVYHGVVFETDDSILTSEFYIHLWAFQVKELSHS